MTDYDSGEALVGTYRRMKRSGAVLILAAMAVLMVIAVLSSGQDTTTPAESAANKRGVHLLLDDGRERWPVEIWSEHLREASQAVGAGGYVTELVRADDLDAARWQGFMDKAAELELKPILRLATVFDLEQGFWQAPSTDADGGYQTIAQDYADFVAALDWPTGEHTVIVGNEPNHGEEWGGKPDPAAYARFLIEVADALHKADPAARVLNAGLDTYAPHTNDQPLETGRFYLDAETFMDEMVAAYPDVFTHIDLWASHAYPVYQREPPWQQTYQIDLMYDAVNPHHVDPPEGVFNRGVNGYEWELWKLSTYGIDSESLPVMITETGWRHLEPDGADSPDADRYPDAATAAIYFDLALRGNDGRYPDLPEDGWTPWLDDSRVIAVTPFVLDGNPAEWGHYNWLVLDGSGEVVDIYPIVDVWNGDSEQG